MNTNKSPGTRAPAPGRHRARILAAILLSLTLSLCLNAAPASAATLSEVESNGTTATANALPADGTVMSGVPSGGTSDADFFAFTLAANARLTLQFTFANNLGTADAFNVDVYDSNGTKLYGFIVKGGNWNGSWLASVPVFASAGRGYVRVYASNSLAGWNQPYSLSITNTPGVVETEDNSTTATADQLAIGSTIQGSSLIYGTTDTDYYFFDLPADGLVTLRFTFPDNLGTTLAYDLDVYDSAGAKMYGFNLNGTGWNGDWLAGEPTYMHAGRWYIRVYSENSRASWGKAYNLTVTSTPGLVETENNGTTATADELPIGATMAGSSLITGDGRDDDYFTFAVASHELATIGFTFPSGLGTSAVYDLYLYNGAGKQVWTSTLTGADYLGSTLAAMRFDLSADRYYLRVYSSNSRTSWSRSYNVRVDLLLTTTVPKISGKAKVGKKLKVSMRAWGPKPVTLAYQWYRSGKAIPAATRSTYKLAKADKHKKITVRVTGTKAGHLSASVLSKATKSVR